VVYEDIYLVNVPLAIEVDTVEGTMVVFKMLVVVIQVLEVVIKVLEVVIKVLEVVIKVLVVVICKIMEVGPIQLINVIPVERMGIEQIIVKSPIALHQKMPEESCNLLCERFSCTQGTTTNIYNNGRWSVSHRSVGYWLLSNGGVRKNFEACRRGYSDECCGGHDEWT
jgi:hypothetical protein